MEKHGFWSMTALLGGLITVIGCVMAVYSGHRIVKAQGKEVKR